MTGRTRPSWPDLPETVRGALESFLGDEVVQWTSQSGGFSPGVADRILTADGRRYFVKAAGPQPHPDTQRLHRREIVVTSALPAGVPAPTLLTSYDDGSWVALLLTDVEGRHPATPWLEEEARAALVALDALADRTTPCPIDGVEDARTDLSDMMSGWERLRDDLPPAAARWARHRGELRDLAHHGIDAVSGDTLVHLDVRADNLLIDASGRVWIVDWPWAARGAAWIDALALVMNVNHEGGPDPDTLVPGSRVLAAASAEDVDGFLAGLAAFFVENGALPPPDGIPHLRAFQTAQGVSTLRWLARRRGWEPPGST